MRINLGQAEDKKGLRKRRTEKVQFYRKFSEKNEVLLLLSPCLHCKYDADFKPSIDLCIAS